ncbi:PaaI family thioesterase [Leptospira sp. 201903071]|uniref:PaaI family thioesterase n=1 Tax=Leptospira ainazelensis TaxID=2810034 RepID=UPI0019660F79|nr:PaaI family thioesterase [Leptospira ainazelensis]MBM9499416.1 PaaI family thioesterase [Leptospira ainazelensis]
MNPFQSMPDVNSPEFIPYFQSQDTFSRKLGYKALQASPGKSEYEIEVDETFHNPVKIVHGAALFAAMDSSAGAAMAAWIKSTGRKCKFMATGTAEIKYRKSVTFGKIKIFSEIIEQKRSTVRLISKSIDPEGDLVAELLSIWVVKFED